MGAPAGPRTERGCLRGGAFQSLQCPSPAFLGGVISRFVPQHCNFVPRDRVYNWLVASLGLRRAGRSISMAPMSIACFLGGKPCLRRCRTACSDFGLAQSRAAGRIASQSRHIGAHVYLRWQKYSALRVADGPLRCLRPCRTRAYP